MSENGIYTPQLWPFRGTWWWTTGGTRVSLGGVFACTVGELKILIGRPEWKFWQLETVCFGFTIDIYIYNEYIYMINMIWYIRWYITTIGAAIQRCCVMAFNESEKMEGQNWRNASSIGNARDCEMGSCPTGESSFSLLTRPGSRRPPFSDTHTHPHGKNDGRIGYHSYLKNILN